VRAREIFLPVGPRLLDLDLLLDLLAGAALRAWARLRRDAASAAGAAMSASSSTAAMKDV
jgi:hypothetical protein